MKNLALSSSLKHLAFAGTFVLASCGSTTPILSTPIENIDQTPVKFSVLTEIEKKGWSHFDLKKDTRRVYRSRSCRRCREKGLRGYPH